MSNDIAVGIVIGGAVSASLGQAVGKTKQSFDELQKSAGNTSGLKALIGETQRLQREVAAADAASRRIGLEGVRKLRGEVAGLEGDWKSATGNVSELARKLAEAKRESMGRAEAVPALEAEHRALQETARRAAGLAEVKRAAWQDARAAAGVSQMEVLALKQQAEAAATASKEARAAATAKKHDITLAKQASAAEQGLSAELEKAKVAAARAKQAYEGKRQELQQTRAALKDTAGAVGDASRQTLLLGDAVKKATSAASPLRQSLDANIRKLKDMGVHVGDLDRAMRKLQQTEKAMQWKTAGRESLQSGVRLGMTAGAGVVGATAIPTKISGDFQAEIRDIAIKAGIAGKADEGKMADAIMALAVGDSRGQGARMDPAQLAQAINGLVTQGMDSGEALGHGKLLAELIRGQKMDPTDAAKLIYAFGQNGVKPEQMRKSMGEVAVAGDIGAFESDKMAKFMPELLATTGALGFDGPAAVRYIAASLQAQVKLTGDPDSAANNFKNLLAKITAPDTDKKFEDAGIDLQGSMKAYIKNGYNPIDAFITLTERMQSDKDPGKRKKMEQVKAKIRDSKNKAEENEALDAYMKMAGLADIMTDQQARMGALAQIKYGGQIKEDLGKIQSTDGGKKLADDKKSRDELSNSKWEAVAADFNAAMVQVGNAVRPATDAAASFASTVLQLGGAVAKEHPQLAALGGVAAGAVGLVAAKRIVGGAAKWIGGAALGGLAGRLPGFKGGKAGAGGVGGKLGEMLGAAAGVQQVYVTNWPSGGMGGGLDLGGPGGGKGGKAGGGRLGKLGGVARGVLGEAALSGRAALMAPSMGSLAGASAGTIAASGAMVAGAGVAGYAAGTAINAGISAALSASTGSETTLGSWLYDKLNGGADKAALGPMVYPIKPKMPAADTGKPAAPAADLAKAGAVAKSGASAPTQHSNTFAPVINVKVMGDVKSPAELANQIMPHLKRLFDQWTAQQRGGSGQLFDPVG